MKDKNEKKKKWSEQDNKREREKESIEKKSKIDYMEWIKKKTYRKCSLTRNEPRADAKHWTECLNVVNVMNLKVGGGKSLMTSVFESMLLFFFFIYEIQNHQKTVSNKLNFVFVYKIGVNQLHQFRLNEAPFLQEFLCILAVNFFTITITI